MGKREKQALALILIILLTMILGLKILPSLLGSTNYLYYFKPLFWLGLSFYIWQKPRCRFKGKLKLHNFLLMWSAICALFYISIFFAGGVLDGIGTSPYAKNLKGIIINVVCFGSVMVAMEWVRNYLINLVKKKYLPLFCLLTVVVFSLYRLNLRVITSLETWQQVVQYLGEYALPEIVSNILLTYMVYMGGAYPAMIYGTLTALPVWVFPVLPDLKWITKAFIGIMMPVVFMLVIRQVYHKQAKTMKLRERKGENPNSWIAVSVFSIILIWFSVGVFQVFPTVILTGSMEPVLYPGDVALIKKCDSKDIQLGDVVQYWTEQIFIIHRVIEIDEVTGEFRTKGDNNTAPDSKPVKPEQIKGKVVGSIPKVGILNVLFRTDAGIPKDKVEF
ncbi:MAG: signal peptidase I [Thermincola sp.]|jgi:signal peptidase|nr:signal peptidase I [Thermincola sp.]MDT3701582.1 signal peptidase I [Thermincola sp.]